MTAVPEQTGNDVKNEFKAITEAEIEALAGGSSYKRGLKYFHDGYVFEAILRGDTLHGQCYGSQEASYALSAVLVRVTPKATAPTEIRHSSFPGTSAHITSYQCECEAGGFCKHLVALLLTWIKKPEKVEVRAAFSTRLQPLSREQLLRLCEQLLTRQPEMEYLLDVISAGSVETADATEGEDGKATGTVSPLANTRTLDVAPLRRKILRLFQQTGRHYDDYYGAASQIASELGVLVRTGDDYARAGQWANAQAVYETVGLATAEEYGEFEDEGELAGVINECCSGLAACLDAQANLPEGTRLGTEARQRLIHALYRLWEEDRRMGGIDLAVDAVEAIARNVTANERAEVETWIQGGMRTGSDFSSSFDRDARARFLVTLKLHSGLSDEEKLAEYRRLGLHAETADLLLQMGRVDEAIATAQKELTSQYHLTGFAARLMELGRENVTRALDFVAELQQQASEEEGGHENAAYLRWLADRYALHNLPDKALEAQQQLFDRMPGQNEYRNVKRMAHLPGIPAETWPKLRPELIAALETRKRWHDVVEIYLEEEQARAALDALAAYDENTAHWQGGDLHARVARLAEADFPNEARVMYQLLAENLIERRGRDNYQLAASYLERAKEMAGKLNRTTEWERYFTLLRETNNRLPALKEELRRRNLM